MEKHKEAIEKFSVKKSGLTPSSPLKMDRKKTDCFFFGFFVLCIMVMVGVTIYGIVEGDIKKLASPYDAAGNLCGYDYEEI